MAEVAAVAIPLVSLALGGCGAASASSATVATANSTNLFTDSIEKDQAELHSARSGHPRFERMYLFRLVVDAVHRSQPPVEGKTWSVRGNGGLTGMSGPSLPPTELLCTWVPS